MNFQLLVLLCLLVEADFGHGRLSDWVISSGILVDKLDGLSEEDELVTWKVQLGEGDRAAIACTENGSDKEVGTAAVACPLSSIDLINKATTDKEGGTQKVHWSKIQITENTHSTGSTIYGFLPASGRVFIATIRNPDGEAPVLQSIRFRIHLQRSNFSDTAQWKTQWEKLPSQLGAAELPSSRKDSQLVDWPSGAASYVVERTISTGDSRVGRYELTVVDESNEMLFRQDFEYLIASSVTIPLQLRYVRWTKSVPAESATPGDVSDIFLGKYKNGRVDPNDFFRVNETYALACVYDGHPFNFEKAAYYWKPYDCTYQDTVELLACSKRIETPGVDDPNGLKLVQSQTEPNRFILALTVVARETGSYFCMYNDSGSLAIDPPKQFVVAESSDGAGIYSERLIPNTDYVYEGDRAVLRCTVNRFRFTSPVWRSKSSGAKVANTSFHQDGYNISLTETKNSVIFDLIILNATVTSLSQYWCSAKERGRGRRNLSIVESKPLNLTVLKAVKPHFGDETSPTKPITRAKGSPVVLYCDARGAPPPEITWTKDDKWLSCDENKCKEGKMEILDGGRRLKIQDADFEDAGKFNCIAKNRLGLEQVTFQLAVEDFWSKHTVILGVCLALAAAVAAAFAVIAARYRRSSRRKADALKELQELEKELHDDLLREPQKLDEWMPTNDQADRLPFDMGFEIQPEEQQPEVTDTVLGFGAFGIVHLAYLTLEGDRKVAVAAKSARDRLDCVQQKSLLREIKLMMHCRHVNVLRLLGVMKRNMAQGQLYAVLEYCKNGSLRDYILRARNDTLRQISSNRSSGDTDRLLTSTIGVTENRRNRGSVYARAIEVVTDRVVALADLLSYAYQIARGLEHLANKNVIHRDIALRNMLLTEEGIVKVSDFGLARRVQGTIEIDEQLPWRWLALEAITHGDFSKKSDVWSYGVVLWELFSYGREPYSDFSPTGFYAYLENGGRLGQPDECPSEIYYELMRRCWRTNKFERPSFAECQIVISNFAKSNCPDDWERVLPCLDAALRAFEETSRYLNIGTLQREEDKEKDEMANAVDNPEYLQVGNEGEYI